MRIPDLNETEDDPLFQLSMMGMVAKGLDLIAVVWECQDDLLYFAGAHAAVGLIAPSLTPAAFRAQLHPDDVLSFDHHVGQCQASAGVQELRLRLGGDGQYWHTLDCRLKLTERDEAGKPLRLLAMLSPVACAHHGTTRQ